MVSSSALLWGSACLFAFPLPQLCSRCWLLSWSVSHSRPLVASASWWFSAAVFLWSSVQCQANLSRTFWFRKFQWHPLSTELSVNSAPYSSSGVMWSQVTLLVSVVCSHTMPSSISCVLTLLQVTAHAILWNSLTSFWAAKIILVIPGSLQIPHLSWTLLLPFCQN